MYWSGADGVKSVELVAGSNVRVPGISESVSFFKAKLEKQDGKLVVDAGSFAVPVPADRTKGYDSFVGKSVVFGIRPEDIYNPAFVPPGIHAAPVETKVDVTELMGNEIFLYLVAGENTIVARIDPRTGRAELVGPVGDVVGDGEGKDREGQARGD